MQNILSAKGSYNSFESGETLNEEINFVNIQ